MKYNEVFNKEYIMKAVRHCVGGSGCADCPYEFAPDCASIEELLCYINELTEENAKLKSQNEELCDELTCLEIESDMVARNVAKKMFDAFEKRLDISVVGYSTDEVVSDVLTTLNNVVKEITGE